jgi:hypothetical protein
MIGLKSYLSRMPSVGLTPEMLYERQRALVRMGVLSVEPGRGPGSGVRADASSIAVFLVSLLAHDLLVESWMTEVIGWMKSGKDRCPLTGKKHFQEAFAAILSDEKFAQRVVAVTVNQNAQSGLIEYLAKSSGSSRLLRSEFANTGIMRIPSPSTLSGLETVKSLKQKFIHQVARDIATFNEGAK